MKTHYKGIMNLNLKTKQYKEFSTWMMKLLTPSSPSAEMVTLDLFALEVGKMKLRSNDCSPYQPSATWLCLPSNLCQVFTMSAYQQHKVGGRCQLSAVGKKKTISSFDVLQSVFKQRSLMLAHTAGL